MKVKAFQDSAGTVADCECYFEQDGVTGKWAWRPYEIRGWPEGATDTEKDNFRDEMENGEVVLVNQD